MYTALLSNTFRLFVEFMCSSSHLTKCCNSYWSPRINPAKEVAHSALSLLILYISYRIRMLARLVVFFPRNLYQLRSHCPARFHHHSLTIEVFFLPVFKVNKKFYTPSIPFASTSYYAPTDGPFPLELGHRRTLRQHNACCID